MLVQNSVEVAEKRLRKEDHETAKALVAVIDPTSLAAVIGVLGDGQQILPTSLAERLKRVQQQTK